MKNFIGKKVLVEAYFDKVIRSFSGKFDQDRILLRRITVNGISFRDHTYIRMSKRWEREKLEEDSNVIFNAFVDIYTNKAEDENEEKFGLRHVRNMRKNVFIPKSFDRNSIAIV